MKIIEKDFMQIEREEDIINHLMELNRNNDTVMIKVDDTIVYVIGDKFQNETFCLYIEKEYNKGSYLSQLNSFQTVGVTDYEYAGNRYRIICPDETEITYVGI